MPRPPPPFSFGTVLARHCFAVKRQCAGAGERGRERLAGRVGVAKVRIHKLSNTYNGHGSPRLCSVFAFAFAFKFNIHIQHSQSAFTLTNTLTHMAHLHTHSQHTYSLPLSTHSTHTHSTHTHTLCKIHIQHLNSILGHTLRVANGQQSPVCPCQPLPLPLSYSFPLVPRPFFQCVCAAFFARCDQKLKNRLQL